MSFMCHRKVSVLLCMIHGYNEKNRAMLWKLLDKLLEFQIDPILSISEPTIKG